MTVSGGVCDYIGVLLCNDSAKFLDILRNTVWGIHMWCARMCVWECVCCCQQVSEITAGLLSDPTKWLTCHYNLEAPPTHINTTSGKC